MGGQSKTAGPVCRGREREEKCFELRIEGKTYREIGKELGITHTAAHKAVTRALKKTIERVAERAGDVRAIEIARLDGMWNKLKSRVSNGEPRAIDTALRIMKRRAELMGLDAPEELNVNAETNAKVVMYFPENHRGPGSQEKK